METKTNNLIALGVTMIINLMVSFFCTIDILSWICFITFVILEITFTITLLQKEKSKCKTKEDYDKPTFCTNLPFMICDKESEEDFYFSLTYNTNHWVASYANNLSNKYISKFYCRANTAKEAIEYLERAYLKDLDTGGEY